MATYEQLLDDNRQWALSEGSRHFEGKSAVQDALLKVTRRLEGIGVSYAVAGGLALFAHGFRRFTEGVDILVTRDGLKAIHARFAGLGYVSPCTGSKNLRDTENGVRLEFLVSGEFPGDGRPKAVAFPDPSEASVELDGISYLPLPKLVELKLASGMTGGMARLKDFADVIALIESLDLPLGFADSLDPYVRDRFLELWNGIRESPASP